MGREITSISKRNEKSDKKEKGDCVNMKMYKQYLKERTNTEMVVSDQGFATYTITYSDEGTIDCYIEDIYVIPEARRGRAASRLADKIKQKAEDMKCSRLLGSVVPSANNSTISLKALIGYGFELMKSEENIIWFKIDL